jgi:hypothetical protein
MRMNPDKKEISPKKKLGIEEVETPMPPQHMDPSKKPATEKENKPAKKKRKK